MRKINIIIFIFIMIFIIQSALTRIPSGDLTLKTLCNESPFFKLNLCNLTCSSCVAGESNKCSECYENYILNDRTGTCSLNNNSYTYYYQSLLNTFVFKTKQLNRFSSQFRYVQLTTEDTVLICKKDSYKFSMVGLFDSQQIIVITKKYDYVISKISIKMNYITVFNNNQVTINILTKSKIIPINIQYTSVSDLNGQIQYATDDTAPSYLSLPALEVVNARSIIQIIDVNVDINDKEFTISIQSKAKTNTRFWGFSDLTILVRQCSNCVSDQLIARINSVGMLILIVLAVLAGLLLLFFAFIMIQKCLKRRKKNKESSLSSKHINFPDKAIKRVLESLDSNSAKIKFDQQRNSLRKTRSMMKVQ